MEAMGVNRPSRIITARWPGAPVASCGHMSTSNNPPGYFLAGCPVCDSPKARPFGVRKGQLEPASSSSSDEHAPGNTDLTLVRCLECGLVYSNPQPRQAVYDKYVGSYDLATYFGALESRKRVLFERRLDAIGPPTAGRSRLLDAGCGDGQFLELAAARGWEPFGIEMNPPAAAKARERGATIWEGTVEEAEGLPWGTFDVVCSWDSIEHTPTPQVFAERFARLMAPGGRGEVTTLNRKSLVGRVMRMKWSMVVDDHFTYWSGGSLSRVLTDAGLEVNDTHYFGLGRDLVAFLDGARKARRSNSAPGDLGDAPAPTWDTKGSVLSAEELANRFLDVTHLGVGVWVSVSRPA